MLMKWLILHLASASFGTFCLAQRGRLTNELGFIHCLCGVQLPYRMQRLQCMEQFVPPRHTYRMHQSVQYCGYFAYKTNFGQTMRQRIHIPNYNPWEPAPDLNTGIICNYTRIKPGNVAPPSFWYVTGKGWVISKCILKMANIQHRLANYMLRTCC